MKLTRPFSVLGFTAALAFTLVLLPACSSTSGAKHRASAAQRAASFRDDMARLRQSVDGALGSLSNLSTYAGQDLRKPFKVFAKNVKRFEAGAQVASDRATVLKTEGAAYLGPWTMDPAALQNPNSRTLAAERSARLDASVGRLTARMFEARTVFDPFRSDLRDLRGYWSTDLTPGGLGAARPLVQKTWADGAAVKTSLLAILEELNAVQTDLVAR